MFRSSGVAICLGEEKPPPATHGTSISTIDEWEKSYHSIRLSECMESMQLLKNPWDWLGFYTLTFMVVFLNLPGRMGPLSGQGGVEGPRGLAESCHGRFSSAAHAAGW